MSAELDERNDEALAVLGEVPIWELEQTAGQLEKREDGLAAFARVFREVAGAREGGYKSRGAQWTLSGAIRHLDEEDAERLVGAAAPFWAAVLDARQEAGRNGW